MPTGRMITSSEGDGDSHPLWLSDEPATAGLWARTHAEHGRSGQWPLLLDALDPEDADFRPWGSGEIFPEQMSTVVSHDPDDLLAKWWAAYTAADEDDDVLSSEERLAVTAPFGQSWPGRAPSPLAMTSADQLAAEYAEVFRSCRPQSRLGLVTAASGAEALTTADWSGPPTTTTTRRSSPRSSATGRTGSVPVSSRSASPPCTSASQPHPQLKRTPSWSLPSTSPSAPTTSGKADGRTHWPRMQSGSSVSTTGTSGGTDPLRRKRSTGNWPSVVWRWVRRRTVCATSDCSRQSRSVRGAARRQL